MRNRSTPGIPGAALALALVLVCCAPPRQVSLPPPETGFEPRQAIEIWREGRAVTLHGVQVGRDSLRGVPLWKPPECDSCQVAVPLQGIDSLRAVEHEKSRMLAMAMPFIVLGAFVLTWHIAEGDD